MGYVSLQPIRDVLPGSLPDNGLATPFCDGATVATSSPGNLSIKGDGFNVDVRTTADGTMWEHVTVRVASTIDAPNIERLNRLLKGTALPKVETDWRTKRPAVLAPGKRWALPVRYSGDLTGEGTLRPSTLDIVPIGAGSPTAARFGPTAVAARFGPTAVVAPAPTPMVVAPTGHRTVPLPALVRAPLPVPVKAVLPEPTPEVASPWEHVSEEEEAMRRGPISPTRAAPEPTPAPSLSLKAERMEPVADDTGIFTFPTVGSGIVTKPGTMEDLDKVWAMHTSGKKQVIAMVGPAGTGKTSLAYDLAAKHRVPIAKVDAAGAVTFADWVGFQSAQERNGATVTEWSPSGFIQAVRADGPMSGKHRIVVVDEVNRAESSGALNALLAVTDHTGSLYIPDALRTIPIDPAVLIVYTANIGASFTGTVSMDAALEDRVTHWVEMLFPTEAVEVALVVDRTGLDESQARRLVQAATQVRTMAERGEIGKGVGPRKVLQAADKVVAGFSLASAATSTWVLSYPADGGERANVRSTVDSALRGGY